MTDKVYTQIMSPCFPVLCHYFIIIFFKDGGGPKFVPLKKKKFSG